MIQDHAMRDELIRQLRGDEGERSQGVSGPPWLLDDRCRSSDGQAPAQQATIPPVKKEE